MSGAKKPSRRAPRSSAAPKSSGRPRVNRRSSRREKVPPQTPSPGIGYSESGPERLHKLMAAAGVGSRRECEKLIEEGRVEVDRKTVTELGTRVDPQNQEVRVDGEVIRRPQQLAYYAVNKPTGVVCTNRDPEGRPRVIDMVPNHRRVYTVGRLDRTSEGLILVTDDGELANRLTHPKFGVPKTYLARVAGHPTHEQLEQLKAGIHLSDGLARVDSFRIKKRHQKGTDLVIVLREGRNREIRRILAKIGHKVLRLKRTAIGNLQLGDLGNGAYRTLSYEEVNYLQWLSRQAAKRIKRSSPARANNRPSGGARGTASGRNDEYAGDETEAGTDGVPQRRSQNRRAQGKRQTNNRTSNNRASSRRSQGNRTQGNRTQGNRPQRGGPSAGNSGKRFAAAKANRTPTMGQVIGGDVVPADESESRSQSAKPTRKPRNRRPRK